MNFAAEKERYISFCGSYCRQCEWFTGKIRDTFRLAVVMLDDYGFGRLLDGKVDKENFRKGLEIIANSGICSGCKAEIAEDPARDRCAIRQCCYRKGLSLCGDCPEFPCEQLKSNPGVIKFGCIENLREIADKGVEFFVRRQWQSEPARSS